MTEEKALLQLKTERDACTTPTAWPCLNDLVNGFPIQQYNLDNRANFARLNLRTGAYTVLCFVEGVSLNACGVSPFDYYIYCHELDDDQFVP